MKELVVISGKGGTGKTSVVAALAVLTDAHVLADCDVDAADLHLVLNGHQQECHDFQAGREAIIRQEDCVCCGGCLAYCRFDAIKKCPSEQGGFTFAIDPVSCEGCGVCVHFCPVQAIDFPEKICGQWFISQTPHGPLVHARLGVAEENSGRLVTLVRQQSQKIAEEKNLDLIVIDGPPGIGCPVIAATTGASMVLVVSEPTLAAIHDLKRVVQLTSHFKIPTAVCVNKYDINPELTDTVETYCREQSLPLLGKIPYDRAVIQAQLAGKSVVEHSQGPAARSIKQICSELQKLLDE